MERSKRPPFPPALAPDDRELTPMMLINEVHKLFKNGLRAEESNMQNSYRPLLFHLAHQDGRTQLELSKLTHLKPPTVSVTLQKMEVDGYVSRQSDENDLRQTRVYLTEKGRAYDAKIRARIRLMEERCVDGLSAEEMDTLNTLLLRVRENLISEGGYMEEHE